MKFRAGTQKTPYVLEQCAQVERQVYGLILFSYYLANTIYMCRMGLTFTLC